VQAKFFERNTVYPNQLHVIHLALLMHNWVNKIL